MRIYTIPNALTLLRFGCVVMLVAVAGGSFGRPSAEAGLALLVFAIGAATDWADGCIARTFPGQASELGKYLDPIADKLLVFAYIMYLIITLPPGMWFEYICFFVIVARELAMVLWRHYGGKDLIPVSVWGKRKTAFQFLALIGYGAWPLYEVSWLYATSVTALFLATAITLYSLFDYIGARQSATST